MLTFRPLHADEIECRVNQISEKGLSLLLYKDARVDQRVLDETVGAMNWQRHHSRDNANCIVSIWDADKKQWIEKEDTGTESNTEAAKGLASDSFKRACFNWGIGRELYTSPRIWITSDKCKISKGNSGRLTCYDKFTVSKIKTENETITGLTIMNGSRVVFEYGDNRTEPVKEEPVERTASDLIDTNKVNAIKRVIYRKALTENSILQHYKRTSFEEMTLEEWMNAMNLLERYADKRD